MRDPEKTQSHDTPTLVGDAGKLHDYPVESWDKYKFVAPLGEGGMGVVYKAFDPKLQRFAALKFLRGDSPLLRTRFLVEARNQAQIEHPHVCKVYEVGEIEGRSFIAMQFIEGEVLNKAKSKLTLEQKVRLMKEVADGIHAAHRIGLIHRDIKPGNILVEKTEAGYHPYVLDFGLARELHSEGVTVTGTFVGTPHYMAPEQAWADTHALDRRADVYSLGATFYELLSGEPPLTGDTTMTVLKKLIEDEPRPLRQIAPALPSDLETIVMKCLEKEPARRYDSARSLADDLQRWLDGEPILARRASLLYRVAKKARKHRAAVFVSAIALVCLITLGAFTVYSAVRARRQATLAQQFGQQVERMENIMRLSRMSPLHDTTPQKQIVRRRILQISGHMQQLGEVALASGHYALGRGHLSLNEYDDARQHLQQSWELGYRESNAAYALGLALGHLFQQQSEQAQQIDHREAREAEIHRLEREYLQPAIQYLQQSRSVEETAPDYVEALIDYYRHRHEEALKKSGMALEQIPWLYEARILQGKIHLATGSEKEDGGDYIGARQDYQLAVSAFDRALQTGASDTEGYQGKCEVYRQWMHMEVFQTGGDVRPLHEGATSSCERAIRADPENTNAMLVLSHALTLTAKYFMDTGQDPMAHLNRAKEAAENAIRAKRSENAHYMLANAWRFQAEYELARGKDPRPSLEQAVANQDSAAKLHPRSGALFETRGNAFMMRAEYEMNHGIDPMLTLTESILAFEKCIEILPDSYGCYNSLANAFAVRSDFEIEHGIDPFASFKGAQKAYEAALRINPNYTHVYNNMGTLKEAEGKWNLRTGKDPWPPIREALRLYDRTIELNPKYQHPYANKAVSLLHLATYERRLGRNPERAVADGLKQNDLALQINDREPFDWTIRAALFLERARHELSNGRNPLPAISDCREALLSAAQLDPDDSTLFSLKGQAHRVQAEWLIRSGKPSRAALDAAQKDLQRAIDLNPFDADSATHLAMVLWLHKDEAYASKALELMNATLQTNPRFAEAHAVQSLLLRQRGDIPAADRALHQALLLNPHLKREFGM